MKAELRAIIEELAPHIARDPRPHPTLRIGAMGHRAIDPRVHPQIAATVDRILQFVRHNAEESLARRAVHEQFTGELELVVVSPLAEGADRLIASIGEAQQYRVGAILPFAPVEYETTFDLGDHATAVAEFRRLLDIAAGPRGYGVLSLDGSSAPPKRDDAYLHCARVLLRWSDIVIAILSGERAASQTGLGVQAAEKPGIPVILIDPAQPDTFELRIQGSAPAIGEGAKNRLAALIGEILGDKATTSADKFDTERRGETRLSLDRLEDYRHERIEADINRGCDLEYSGPYRVRPESPVGTWWSGLNRCVERCAARLVAGKAPPLPNYLAPAPTLEGLLGEPTVARSVVALYLRYHRADQVANVYGDLYRSIQIIIAFAGILTVIFALIDAAIPQRHPLFALLELVSLGVTLSLVWVAEGKRWLDRWLDSRLLAEVLRYSKFLLLTGRPSPFTELRGIQVDESDERVWTRNHIQHILRSHHIAVPGRGRMPIEGMVDDIAQYVLGRCIHDQIAYHQKTQRVRRELGDLFHRLSRWLAIITVLAVALKFVLELRLWLTGNDLGFERPVITAVEVVAIVFLASTMALLIIRTFAEYSVVAKRSAAVINALEKESRFMQDLIGGKPNLERVGASMLRAARVLLREVDGWFDLFADKHIEM